MPIDPSHGKLAEMKWAILVPLRLEIHELIMLLLGVLCTIDNDISQHYLEFM